MESTTRAADRRQTMAVVLAALLGLALVAAMITRTSEAAFTATTDNTGNTFTAGTIQLSDDDGGATALFDVTGMEPGDVVEGCIVVTYNGTVNTPGAVTMYSGGFTDVFGSDPASDGLSDNLLVTIQEGTSTTGFNDCTGFTATSTIHNQSTLAAFDTAANDYASGVGTWTPSGDGDTQAYRVEVELNANTPNAEQGAATNGLGFTWEVQS